MSYQVLARKWRPQAFSQMVGQEHVLRMLSNALDQQRLHHAYLFTGTRGVGKTTIARIFAKCLNCETGITTTACGTCATCQAIDAGKFLDLLEVDAASRTKVEDTRELLENVQYPPVQGRFKIYLIDEVHMLSGHSFNALLKTLEEPPHYVKFLLATTDPKRLPITILSRCLQFNLKRVSAEKIMQQLAHICTTEKISFELPALKLIAQAADGSMRDALSLLDQNIAYCQNSITERDTQQMLGSIDHDIIFRILETLANQNGQQLLAEIAQLAEYAPDFSSVLEELLSTLHQISIAQIAKDALKTSAHIEKFAAAFSAEEVQLYYQIALTGRRDLPFIPHPQQGFEMIMLRMLAFRPVTETSISPVKKTNTSPAPSQNWNEILAQLELSGVAQVLAANCKLEKINEKNIELTLAAHHQSMLNAKILERIETALSGYFNRSIQLKITLSHTEIETPAKQQQEEKVAKQNYAVETLKNDKQIKKMMDLFDATLDEDSIKSM